MNIEILKIILLFILLGLSITSLIIITVYSIATYKINKTIESIKREQKEQENPWTSNYFDKKI